jgi:TnpA family transposase
VNSAASRKLPLPARATTSAETPDSVLNRAWSAASVSGLKNKTRRALWEYDHLLRSLYLLDYIDSSSLRRNVQRALNRGENYHQLRRAVSYANFGKLRFKTEHEQQSWGECARLITNCIIYYNTRLLSDLLDCKEAAAPRRRCGWIRAPPTTLAPSKPRWVERTRSRG